MKLATVVIQNVIRLLAVVLLVLGFLFWSGHGFQYVPTHRGIGILAVVLLWILSVIAFAARVKPVLALAGLLWGALVLWFGNVMPTLMPGPRHEVVRVLHFFIGLSAIGLAEMLSARIKRSA